jgi:hypothetical protein
MRDTKSYKAYMGLLITTGFLTCIYILIHTEIQPGNREVVLVLTGALGAMVKDVFGFYFGSSEGSQRKTELMEAANADTTAQVVGQ